MQVGFLVAAIIVNLSLAAVIFTRIKDASSTAYFALSSLFIVGWAAGTLAMLYGSDDSTVYLGLLLFLISPMVTALFMLLFAKHITEIDFPRHHIATIISASITVACALYVAMNIDAESVVTIVQGAQNSVDFQHQWFYIYGAFFSVTFFSAYLYLFGGLLKRRGRQRRQLIYVASGISATSFLALITNVLLPMWGNSDLLWLGPTWTLLYVVTTSYAMARYRLFDLRQALVLTFTYVLSLGALAVLYLILGFAVSKIFLPDNQVTTGSNLINTGLALLLAFLFQPVRRFFDKLTNKIFYEGEYNTDDFYALLSKTLTSTTDLHQLLRRSSEEIGKTLKATQTFFFVYNPGGHSIQSGTTNHSKLPTLDARWLDEQLVASGQNLIVLAMLPEEDHVLRRFMISHRLAIILPLIKQDEGIIGYLCLGEHRKNGYTQRDLRVLGGISNELVIAIENALSLLEVRELNTTLQQRVDDATKELRASNAQLQRLDKAKDDFISMASHQLRTPLTSVKGYISMVREGDAGKITKAQDQLLDEAFTSSERMVHLINDFLNVSRLQTGKFLIDKRPVNLAKLIEQELDSLMTNAKSRNLTFMYSPPKDFPMLNLDEDKMRQVVMNFSDNVIYYSTEGTKVKVKLAVEGKDAVFTVTDTGIGVPRAEQSQLFNKFYRASNARKQRPDGTGVGLYLAKKVIDAHGGKVIFESTEGKGSTFGFRLPIDELRVASDTDKLKD